MGILKLASGLEDQILEHHSTDQALVANELSNFFDLHSRCSRTDHVGSLRYASMNYIPAVQDIPPIDATTRNKSDRGFSLIASARLLCPRSMRDDFDANRDNDSEVFFSDVRDGATIIAADEWPSFLYPEGGYDPEAIDENPLRGPFLPSCFHHIFTGPRTAMKSMPGKTPGKKCLADLHHMTKVTPANIAYAAVLARFVLSSQEEWGDADGNFNCNDFYNNIMDLSDEPEGDLEWSDATLEWFDVQVFGLKVKKAPNASRQTGVSILTAQRAARKATAKT